MKVYSFIKWNEHLEIRNRIDFGGNYEITESGKVINKYGRTLRGSKNKNGYIVFTLIDVNGNSQKVSAHQLVAQHYHSDTMVTGKSVDHIDRNRENNHKENIRWATYAEQINNRNDYAYIRYLEDILIQNNIEF